MATVSIPLSPHAIGMMAGRRVPLSNVPNLANSPLRPAAGKRGRTQSNATEDALHGQAPPAKKQFVDLEQPISRTPTRKPTSSQLSRVAAEGAPVRKAPAPKEREGPGRTARQEKTEIDNRALERVDQWQKHYRKVFPTFVFYFDGVPDDSRRLCLNGLAALGAREEKFFSRDITHVVTTRSLPTDQDRSTDTTGPSSATPSGQDASQPRTINPSLLDKTADNFVGASKSRFTFEVPSTRRVAATIADADTSKPTPAPAQVNVLQKAKALGIKIWNLEKLQRILVTMFEDGQPSHSHNTRSNATIVAPQPRAPKQNDLSQMIKNEQLHERGDRELGLGNSELIPLKGPHIYIRDMNEKTKPIMIREYPKVQRREEGEWPQFRSASSGKCPFVEEDSQSKQQAERERQREKERAALVKAKAQEKMDRRPLKSNLEEMKPPPRVARKEPLGESKSAGNSGASHTSHHLPPPTVEGTMKASLAFQRPGFVRGEPMASGMQQSNITSAIRSQMISSTAPVPGAKAGTSKEVHGLQRKVLERNNGPVGLVASQRMVDIAGTAARMGTANPRAAKQKAQEKLGYKPEPVLEDDGESEEEVKDTRKFSVQRTEKREPKPGYCENCREKFDDFDTHTLSRKHRKFATDKENWKELDDLLSMLVRPLRASPEV